MPSLRRYGRGANQATFTNPVDLKQGSTYIADTAAHIGDFGAIQVLDAAVGNLVTGDDPLTSGTLTSVALPVGVTIYGHFTTITLASGKVLAYNK